MIFSPKAWNKQAELIMLSVYGIDKDIFAHINESTQPGLSFLNLRNLEILP